MSGNSQRRVPATGDSSATRPAMSEARSSFFSVRTTGDPSSGKSASLSRGPEGPAAVAAPVAMPRHLQATVAAASSFSIAGGLDANGLSKSLNDLDVRSGHLKEDTSLVNLQDEQRRLKQDVSDKTRAIAKLQKISEELTLLLQQHHHLQEAASKRERLGQTMRQRLEERCQKLESTNRLLNGQLEQERISPGSTHVQAREDLKQELVKRDQMIRSLHSQHDTCVTNIEQLQQQHTRLQQDMAWLKVLDGAVLAADSKLQAAEDELSRQAEFNSRLPKLEEEFRTLQASSNQQRTEQGEYINHLQGRASELSGQLRACGDELLPLRVCVPPAIVHGLEQLVVQRDQHITVLTEEAFRWQQLYMDELRESTALSEAVSHGPGRSSVFDSSSASMRTAAPHAVTSNLLRSDGLRQSGRQSREQQHERRKHDLQMALQHQVQLEAGLKTLEHVIGEHDMELLEMQRQQAEEDGAEYGPRHGFAHSGRSGAATPGSIFSFPPPGQSFKSGHWATSSFRSMRGPIGSGGDWEACSASASPVRKLETQQAHGAFSSALSVTLADGALSSKDAVILQIQDDCMV